MKKIYLFLFLTTFCIGKAQELTIPTFTQYLADNPFVISPAYAGIGDNVKIRANGLTQWVGIKNAPDMQSVVADGRIANRTGVGLFMYNDQNGNTKQKGAKFSFAHHLIIDKYEEQFLSFGMSYNMNFFRIATEDFTGNDFAVTNDRSVINHNFDISFLYRNKGYYASVTASNILNKEINFFGINEPAKLRNFQFYTGYVYKTNADKPMEIEPSAYVQYFAGDKRSSTDLNLKVRFMDFEDYYWFGVSYRFLNDQAGKPLNIGPMAGLKKSKFYFAYSYQLTSNELSSYNSGTHMITIGLDVFQGISNCACAN
jgi:type IX secretion system PorP/SprF family membrane protein